MEMTREELLLLRRSPLFAGVGGEKLRKMLDCLHARRAFFAPGDFLLRQGEAVAELGVVLAGQARSLAGQGDGVPLTRLAPGSPVGLFLAAAGNRKSPVSVRADTPLEALFFPSAFLLAPCRRDCPEHRLLLRNYLTGVAEKSLALHDRLECLARRTVREKILAYLEQVSLQKGGVRAFTVPLDRNGMAAYLNIDRAALSRELSRMKREGLLDFHRDHFRLPARENSPQGPAEPPPGP